MTNQTATSESSIAQQLRPIVTVVAAVSVTVFALLVATASFGASPIDSMGAPVQIALSE